MIGLVYRQAAATDAEQLARLHALCFDKPWGAGAFVRLLSRPCVLGLLAERPPLEGPQAFALLQHVAGEAEILTLGVEPACRGQGLAAGLLARALIELARRGVERVHLEVAADNVPARALYRSAGFTATGRRAGYYRRGSGPPVDGLVLTRALDVRSGS